MRAAAAAAAAATTAKAPACCLTPLEMGTQAPSAQVGLGIVMVPVEPPVGLLTVVVRVGAGALQELLPVG